MRKDRRAFVLPQNTQRTQIRSSQRSLEKKKIQICKHTQPDCLWMFKQGKTCFLFWFNNVSHFSRVTYGNFHKANTSSADYRSGSENIQEVITALYFLFLSYLFMISYL